MPWTLSNFCHRNWQLCCSGQSWSSQALVQQCLFCTIVQHLDLLQDYKQRSPENEWEMVRDTALLSPSLGIAGFKSAHLQTCLEVFFCACFPRHPSSLVSPEKADPSTASVILCCLLFLKRLCWEAGHPYQDPCSMGHQTLAEEHVVMCHVLTLGKFNY